MQALIVERVNGPFVLTRMLSPALGAHQALIRVHASGVNPLDIKIRAGNAAHARVVFPAVLGLDLAGVVEEIGNEVTEFREGDEVYAMGGGIGGLQGSLATQIAVDVDLLALHWLSESRGPYGTLDLRGLALGRKSRLFAGSERGAQRAAVMYTLIETAKLKEVDPQGLARRCSRPHRRHAPDEARRSRDLTENDTNVDACRRPRR